MQNIESTTQIGGLFRKCYEFTRADDIKAAGIYPYFRAIQESEGPVVHMEGKPVVMAGSNNYLGLTTHPKVKEAAIRALEKYKNWKQNWRILWEKKPHYSLAQAIRRVRGSLRLWSEGVIILFLIKIITRVSSPAICKRVER